MSGFLGKYSRILLVIIIFLLLVLSVLGLNFYNSFRIEKDAQLVDSIGEQGTLSQRISKSLLQALNAYTAGEDYSENMDELIRSSESFDSRLSSLQLNTNLTEINDSTVKGTAVIWQPLFTRIKTIEERLTEEKEIISQGKATVQSSLARLADTARVSTLVLEKLITELADENLNVQGADSAFIIEKNAVLAIKLEELVLITEDRYFKGLDVSNIVNEIQTNVDALNTAIKGYRTKIAEGAPSSQINSYFSQRELVDEIDILWAPLKSDAEDFLQVVQESSGKSSVPSLFLDALSYSNANMNGISNNMDGLVGEVGTVINQSADSSRFIQILGIVGSSLCFLYILAAFFGRLRQSDEEVELVQRESEKIFETIDQGVFLLNENAVIGNQYSKELLNIFGAKEVANKQLLKFLKDIVSEEDLEKLSRYIKLLFDPHKKEQLIQDLNPLNEVSTQVFQNGRMVNKHLRFSFSRVVSNNKVENVLTSVSDISREIKLRDKLEQESKRGEQQLNLLTTLLNSNAEMLPMFLDNSDNAYNQINNTLRADSQSADDYREKANKLGTLIHMVKGESSALSIGIVSDTCHEFETELEKIKENHHVDGNNFLPLTILLERLIGYNKLIRELNERVFSKKLANLSAASDPQVNSSDVGNTKKDSNWTHLFSFAKELAERTNKNVKLRYSGLDAARVNEELSSELSVLTSQFLRNAIVHGIEQEPERAQKKKPKVGQVSVSLYRQDNGYVFECLDDGNGIDVNKLAQTAVAKGFLKQEELDKLPQQKLVSLIFKQGFSMQDTVDEDSGRGMGMSAIYNVVKKLKGRISISTKVGEFTRFSIYFPDDSRNLKAV